MYPNRLTMPLPALALPYAIGAGVQGATALWQLAKSAQLAKTPRPKYEIPEAAKAALANAQLMASQRELPGQSIMEQKIAGSTANAIGQMKQAADSPAAILGGIGKLAQNEQGALGDLAYKAANYYANNQAQLRAQLGNMGQYQANQWQWDKQMPYQKDMAASSAMLGAGLQNLYGAGQGIGNAMGANKIMGTQGSPTVSANGVNLKFVAPATAPTDTNEFETYQANKSAETDALLNYIKMMNAASGGGYNSLMLK